MTLGAAVTSGDFSNVGPFILAQLAGAILGASLVWVQFLPHWRETKEPDLKLACFSTGPAIRAFVPNLLSEVIGTFVLVLVAGAIFSKAGSGVRSRGGIGPVPGRQSGVGASDSASAAPPATRSIRRAIWGPRIAHAILPIAGKGSSDWGYSIVPVVGPLIGGALAGAMVRMLGF